jgi:hypothetical protein
VTEAAEKREDVLANRLFKLAIVMLVFPILALVLHELLVLPALIVGYFIMHFVGHPKTVGETLSFLTMIPACWGAVVMCKWIWPGSK